MTSKRIAKILANIAAETATLHPTSLDFVSLDVANLSTYGPDHVTQGHMQAIDSAIDLRTPATYVGADSASVSDGGNSGGGNNDDSNNDGGNNGSGRNANIGSNAQYNMRQYLRRVSSATSAWELGPPSDHSSPRSTDIEQDHDSMASEYGDDEGWVDDMVHDDTDDAVRGRVRGAEEGMNTQTVYRSIGGNSSVMSGAILDGHMDLISGARYVADSEAAVKGEPAAQAVPAPKNVQVQGRWDMRFSSQAERAGPDVAFETRTVGVRGRRRLWKRVWMTVKTATKSTARPWQWKVFH